MVSNEQKQSVFLLLTENDLEKVNGGVSCFQGVVGLGGLGAQFGPWGMVGGMLIGAAGYCLN